LVLALLVAPRANAAPAWLAPVDLSEEGQKAGGPQVAFDGQGDAVAVWESADGTGKYGLTTHVVQSAFRPAGGSWQAPVSVGWCSEGRCEPQVGIDSHGDAVALWETYTGFTFVVESSYRPAGGAWQAPVVLSPEEIPGAAHPKLAVNGKGDAIAVWDRGSAIDAVTQAAFMPAGGTWQAPVDISPEGDSAFEPQVAFDGHGDALVLWYHVASYAHYTYEYIVQSAFMPAGGAWQAPVSVSALGLAGGLQVRFDEQGNAAAIWDQWTNGFLSSRTVQAASMSAGGTWRPSVSIVGAEDELDQPKGAGSPGIAVDGQGDAVAVWAWEFGDNIQAAFRPAEGTWQAPVNISGEDASSPQVAFDGQGDALAAWDSSSGAVQAAFKPAGGAWEAPVNIGHGGGPQIAFDGQGDALAAWAAESGIQAVGYVGAGPRLNSLSVPTTGVVGQPVTFSVAPLDEWSVLGETSWGFGDGASTIGTSVTHTYTAAGTYEVTLRSADTLGNVTTGVGEITIAPAPPTPSSTPKLAPSVYAAPSTMPRAMRPTISDASQSASTWREGGKPPVGTTFFISLNEQATVSFSFARRVSGRMIGHKCAPITSKNIGLKPCQPAIDEGVISFAGHSGMNELVFHGRISRLDTLKPGRYTLTITATNSTEVSAPTSLNFTLAK
jgi:plastocyanin